MNDLEDRLRTTLGELADTVPPSPHARADLDRRLGRAPRRRVLLTAAAAAAVVAAVTVPLAVSGTGPVARPAVPLPGGSASASPGVVDPVVLGRFGDHAAVLTVPDGERMCVAETVPAGQAAPAPTCEPVPGWPAEPMGLVITRQVLGEGAPDSGPLPHLMLFVTAPEVRRLDVRRGDGAPVPVDLVTRTRDARFFLADFGGSTQGFGYTARDASGAVVEEAIT